MSAQEAFNDLVRSGAELEGGPKFRLVTEGGYTVGVGDDMADLAQEAEHHHAKFGFVHYVVASRIDERGFCRAGDTVYTSKGSQ